MGHPRPDHGARRGRPPGGRAAFSEPLGINPLVVFARNHLPYPGKHERGADRPLTRGDLDAWRAPFRAGTMRPVQLFSMLERALGSRKRIPLLREFDGVVLTRFPGLGPWCRYGILYFQA